MRLQRLPLFVAAIALLSAPACRTFKRPLLEGTEPRPTLAADTYINEGTDLNLIVGVRASKIAGPQRFLPLQLAIHNRADEFIDITRESFILETPDGTQLPVASYAEFGDGYPRHRVDLRVGRDFVETLGGRFPSPPYIWRGLDFFPLRESGTAPRDRLEIRKGEIAIGFIYFSLPDSTTLSDAGECTLLFRPKGGAQYVVDARVYRVKKQKKNN